MTNRRSPNRGMHVSSIHLQYSVMSSTVRTLRIIMQSTMLPLTPIPTSETFRLLAARHWSTVPCDLRPKSDVSRNGFRGMVYNSTLLSNRLPSMNEQPIVYRFPHATLHCPNISFRPDIGSIVSSGIQPDFRGRIGCNFDHGLCERSASGN